MPFLFPSPLPLAWQKIKNKKNNKKKKKQELRFEHRKTVATLAKEIINIIFMMDF